MSFIAQLKNKNLSKVLRLKVEKLTSDPEFSKEKLSDFCLTALLELYKLLSDKSWSEDVDGRRLSETIVYLCTRIKCKNEKDAFNFLASICTIYRFLTKKNVNYDAADGVFNYIFNDKMDPKHQKMYWAVMVDKIFMLEKSNPKENKLNSLMRNIRQLFNVLDSEQLHEKNLVWLLKKLTKLCEIIDVNELKTTLEHIFCQLLKIQKVSLKLSDAETVYKNVIFIYVLLHNLNTSTDIDITLSMKLFIKLTMDIFKNLGDFKYFLSAVESSSILLKKNVSDFDDKHVFNIENMIQCLTDLKNSPNYVYEEFIMSIRRLISSYINIWIKVDSDIWTKHLSVMCQKSLIKLILHVVDNLRNIRQQNVLCDNCTYQSAIHEALHLSSLTTNIVSVSTKNGMDVNELVPLLVDLTSLQTEYIIDLVKNKCPSTGKFWEYIERNTHSDAILLHSAGQSKSALRLFDVYFTASWRIFRVEQNMIDLKKLARGFHNRAICLLSLEESKKALFNCYTSLALSSIADPNWETKVTYMKLAVQSKLKVPNDYCSHKSNELKEPKSLIACQCSENILKSNVWSCMTPENLNREDPLIQLLADVDFGKLLLFELESYSNLWFSTMPIIGICEAFQSLFDAVKNKTSNLGKTRMYNLIEYCGKAVTIIATQSNKLQNSDIFKFIEFATNLLEKLTKQFKNLDTKVAFARLLYGNCLRALYECVLLDKLKREPPPSLLTTTSAPPQLPHHTILHPDDICDVAPTHQSLTLTVEENFVDLLINAVDSWREVLTLKDIESSELFLNDSPYKLYMDKTLEIMDVVTQTLSLRSLEIHALKAADVAYSFATLCSNDIKILPLSAFIIEKCCANTPEIREMINKSNSIVKNIIMADKVEPSNASLCDAAYEYLLSLSIFYMNSNRKNDGFIVLSFVHNKILKEYQTNENENSKRLDDLKYSFSKLIYVQSLYLNTGDFDDSGESVSLLTTFVNAFVKCSTLVKSAERLGRQYPASLKMFIDCGIMGGRISMYIGQPRRARAILRSLVSIVQKMLLPRPTLELLQMLAHIDLATERFDDCKVKLDSIDYIIEENKSVRSEIRSKKNERADVDCKVMQNTKNDPLNRPKQFEMILDLPEDARLNGDLGGSPVFQSAPFVMPSFIDHNRLCACYGCSSISFFGLMLDINHTKSELRFKTGDPRVAGDYFDGGIKLCRYFNNRLEYISELHFKKFSNFTLEDKKTIFHRQLAHSEAEFNITVGYYYITENDHDGVQNINDKVFKNLSMYEPPNHFLVQKAWEQKLCLIHSKSAQSERANEGLVPLTEDMDKLQITPEKRQNIVFKTPANRPKMESSNARKVKRNMKVFNDDRDETSDCIKPIIKLNLDDECIETDSKAEKSSPNVYQVDKTPAPKIDTVPKLLPPKSAAKTTRSAKPKPIQDKENASSSRLRTPSNRSRLIRSTSPGPLDETPHSQKSSSKVKKTDTAKIKKANLSPDVNLVKKYPTRRRL